MRKWENLLDIVHGTNGILRILLLGITDESKSSAATGISIFDYDL